MAMCATAKKPARAGFAPHQDGSIVMITIRALLKVVTSGQAVSILQSRMEHRAIWDRVEAVRVRTDSVPAPLAYCVMMVWIVPRITVSRV